MAHPVLDVGYMTIVRNHSFAEDFDDSFFFQRLTLIDICCGPPSGR
jgi:hypothetical protein